MIIVARVLGVKTMPAALLVRPRLQVLQSSWRRSSRSPSHLLLDVPIVRSLCPTRAALLNTRLLFTTTRHFCADAISDNEAAVRQELEQANIVMPSFHKGAFSKVSCPKCGRKRSLAVHISPNGTSATWSCCSSSCSYIGSIGGKKGSHLVKSKTSGVDANNNRAVGDFGDGGSSSDLPLADSEATPFGMRDLFYRNPNINGWSWNSDTSSIECSQPSSSGDQGRLFPVAALVVACSKLTELSDELKLFFSGRGISEDTLLRNKVKQTFGHQGLTMVFPYIKDKQTVNLKYRSTKKHFWQERNTLRVLYGLDDIRTANHIIIVEGEIDKLSMEEAGFLYCASVPDGAPSKVSENMPVVSEDKKFQFIWNSKDYLEKASRITLATDGDEPGQALAEELARRLGRERCWRVSWPKASDGKTCKDANEVLTKLGKEALRDVVLTAEPYPIRGLITFPNFFKDLDNYYHLLDGHELGVSTGWDRVDACYRVVPGELTLITGVPSSGKSEWIDALMCNLVEHKGWAFGLCSMENKVREHARKLLEKYLKKPFFDDLYSKDAPRMTPADLERGKQWLDDNFYLIRCEDEQLPSIDWILKLAKAAVMRHGIRGLVIDPYNELDHQRPPSQSETEYVSQMLTKIKRFAHHYSCHVWFVAHPRQMQSWNGGAPNIYDISGSAHFINKCDNGIVIHRNHDPHQGPMDQVQIFVRKVRNKAAGTIGEAFLHYDRSTGIYSNSPQQHC